MKRILILLSLLISTTCFAQMPARGTTPEGWTKVEVDNLWRINDRANETIKYSIDKVKPKDPAAHATYSKRVEAVMDELTTKEVDYTDEKTITAIIKRIDNVRADIDKIYAVNSQKKKP